MAKEYLNFVDLVDFQEGPGVRNTQYTSSGVKLLNVANLVDGHVDLSTSDRYISENEAYGKYKHFLCKDGDFVIATSGIKVEYIEKKMGFISKDMLPLCMNTSTVRFRVKDKTKLNIRYFMYYLKSQNYKKQLARYITGSAQLNYGPSHLKKMKMPIAPISEQLEIVKNLDYVSNLIVKEREKLEKLDLLIKARFVEMFGSIYSNVKNLPIKTLNEVCAFIKDGTHQTPTYTEKNKNSFMFLSSKNVTSGKINWKDIKYIPKDLHEVLQKRVKPIRDDILLAKNGTTGVCALVDEDYVFDVYVSLAVLRPDNINSVYLWAAINSLESKHQFDNSLKGVGVPNLHLKEIKKARILIPSLSEQNQFADFVTQVEKVKADVQKSLDKTQMLFDSLMQQYFE